MGRAPPLPQASHPSLKIACVLDQSTPGCGVLSVYACMWLISSLAGAIVVWQICVGTDKITLEQPRLPHSF